MSVCDPAWVGSENGTQEAEFREFGLLMADRCGSNHTDGRYIGGSRTTVWYGETQTRQDRESFVVGGGGRSTCGGVEGVKIVAWMEKIVWEWTGAAAGGFMKGVAQG